MRNFSSKLQHPIFKVVSQVSTHREVPCYVVGGFVRDLILERASKDIDIVVVGDGMTLAKEIALKLKVKKVSYTQVFR